MDLPYSDNLTQEALDLLPHVLSDPTSYTLFTTKGPYLTRPVASYTVVGTMRAETYVDVRVMCHVSPDAMPRDDDPVVVLRLAEDLDAEMYARNFHSFASAAPYKYNS